jgi:uncharacterized protein (TIGR02246 family)
MKKTIVFFAGGILLLSGCQQKADTKAEGEKLMQVSREWSQAAGAHDIEKTLSYWTDDAVVMSPMDPAKKGKKEIRQMVEGSFKVPGFKISWEPQSAVVSESGDLGYLMEKTEITMTDSAGKSMTQHFNGTTIWKKQADGSWKNVVDILTQ